VARRQLLTEAKVLACELSSELAAIDCPLAVLGTALAIIVGTIAAQVDTSSRDGFYEKFIEAAQESEFTFGKVIRGYPRIH
jgi:hypothetical protein